VRTPRLGPVMRAVAAAAGCLVPACAQADPVSAILVIAEIAAASTYVKAFLLIAAAVYTSTRARRKARAANAEAKARHNSSVQDRQFSALTSAPFWRVRYGRQNVGGDVVAIFTSDKTGRREDGTSYTKADALKHVVIELAHHECASINEIYIDGAPVGLLDGNGYPTGGEFFSTRTDSRIAVIGGGGTVVVPETVLAILQAYTNDGSGEGGNFTDVTGSVTGVGTTTISGPANATVNYTVQTDLPSVRVQKHLGQAGQVVDAYLNGLVPSQWDSTHPLTGSCYVVLTLDLENPRFQGGLPNPTFDTRGKKCFDPRTGLTAYTENPAIIIRDWLMAPWGYGVSASDIDDATVIAAANACDARSLAASQAHSATCVISVANDDLTFTSQRWFSTGDGVRFTTTGTLPTPLVAGTTYYVIEPGVGSFAGTNDRLRFKVATSLANALAGTAVNITGAGSGTHTCVYHDYPTYTCNGAFTTGDPKERVLEELGGSMAGGATNAGLWVVNAGAWSAPVMDLTTDKLDGFIEVPDCDTDWEELFNGVRGLYVPRGYAAAIEYGTYQNAAFKAADNNKDLWEDRGLPYTDAPHRVRNICRVLTEQNRNGLRFTYPAKLQAWGLQVGDRVRVTSAELGATLKEFRVVDWNFDMTSAVLLGLEEDAAAAYDLSDAATADPTPNSGLPNPWVVQGISGVSAFSSADTGLLAADGSWQPRVRVTWTPATDAFLADGSGRIVVLWRDPRANVWQRTEVLSNETGAWVTGVKEGDPLVIEVAARNGLGQLGPPSFLAHTVAVTQLPGTYQGAVLLTHGVAGSIKLIGNSAIKVGPSGAWDAGFYGAPISGASELSFVVGHAAGNDECIVGLNTDPTADASYASIDYGIVLRANGDVDLFESNVQVVNNVTTYALGDAFRISYDEVAVRYWKGATLLRQIGVSPGLSFGADSSFFHTGARVNNIVHRAISAAPRGNLLDPGVWVIGTSGDQGTVRGSFFQAETLSGENSIIHSLSPEGRLRPVWQGLSGDAASGDRDGGFRTGEVPVDHTKPYRISVWTRAVVRTGGGVYLGLGGSDWGNPNGVADIATGAAETNPYPIESLARLDLAVSRWYLLVGHVLPSTIGTTPPNPIMGGVYDGVTGQKVLNATRDFKWLSTATVTTMRLFQFNTAASDRQDFWGPRIEMCDGNEPSVDELLAAAKLGLTNNSSPDFESQFALNGQMTRWLLGAALPEGWLNIAGTVSKETTITRTGPNAIRLVSAGGAATYVYRTIDFGLPLVAGSFVEGTADFYLDSHTSGGYPGLLVRCFTNAALSTQRDTLLNLPNTTADEWQTIAFKAAVNAGERIYGVRFYLMASYSLLSGGDGVNNVVFDSLVARAVQPSDTAHLMPDSAAKIHLASFEAGPVTYTTIT
jgi:hypothetical protein